MTPTGNYIIRYYDKYGSLTREIKDDSDSFTQAQKKGNLCLSEHTELRSFTIDRRVHNTLDKG